MTHVEGGWPREIDYSEAQDTLKYRKRLEKDWPWYGRQTDKVWPSSLAVAIGYGTYFSKQAYLCIGLAQFCCIVCGCCFYVLDFHWKNCCRLVTELDISFGFQLEFSFEPKVRNSESPLWSRWVKTCGIALPNVRILPTLALWDSSPNRPSHVWKWHLVRIGIFMRFIPWLRVLVGRLELGVFPAGMVLSPRNNTIDLFEIYFQEEEPDHMPEILNLKTIALFKDARQK